MNIPELTTLATVLGLGFFSGLNLYAVVFVSGLAIRLHWLDLSPSMKSLEILADEKVLIVSGFMYAIEFFADKIPWIDNFWDAIHTVIRPLAAVFLALYVLGDLRPEIRIVAALICGTLALGSHAAKAGTRLSTNIVSPAEPFSNISLSLAEDAITIGSLYLGFKYPFVTLAIVAVLMGIILWFTPKLFRAVRSLFRAKPSAPDANRISA
jgi:Domain of unknown function (DUF4126)